MKNLNEAMKRHMPAFNVGDVVKDVNDYIQCKLINLEAKKAAVEMEIIQLKTELKSVGR